MGLNAILDPDLDRLVSKIDCMIKKFFNNLTSTVLTYDSLPYPKQLETVEHPGIHWAFYSLPGCGKTRPLEILLSKYWGFIFSAGSLPVTENDTKRSLASDSNIYDPRREGYSKDLYYLWMTIKTCFQELPGHCAPTLIYRSLSTCRYLLLVSRILVFERFLSIAPDAKPADWLQFQKNFDPFSPLLWLLLLQQSVLERPIRRHLNVRQKLSRMNVRKVFVALDEAQHDLNAKFCSEKIPPKSNSKFCSEKILPKSNSKSWLEDTTMLQVFNEIDCQLESVLVDRSSSSDSVQVTKLISGMSLRLDEMMDYLGEPRPGSWRGKSRYLVYSDFPLLRSEKDSIAFWGKVSLRSLTWIN